MYQPKPAETNIGNYSTVPNGEGLLSRLNPTNSIRGRIFGAFTAASLLAGCTSAMDIYGRNKSTNESRMVRVGQEPLEANVGRAALNFILPVKAVVDAGVYSLYSDFKAAVDDSLCNDKDLLTAGKKVLPENVAQTLYNKGCIEYSEGDVGKILETLTDTQKSDLSTAVKNVLNGRISVVYLASNDKFAVLPQTYVIDNVKIDSALIPEVREGLNVVASGLFWFGVAKAIGAATSSGSTTTKGGAVVVEGGGG